MGERSNMVSGFTKLLLFKFFNFIFCAVRKLFWIYNGTEAKLSAAKENYANSAQKLHIWYEYHIDLLAPVSLSNFLLTHEEFLNPEYVLKDEVTLLQITESEAIFIEADKNKPPPFSARYGFFLTGQFDSGVKVITMPIASFATLVDKVADNPAKLLFILNHGRCGSTLLMNVLDQTGRAVTFGEPRALDSVCKLYGRAWDDDVSKAMLRRVIRILTKPYHGYDQPPLVYVIRPSSVNAPFTTTLRELFPESVYIFIYRDPTTAALSIRRIAAVLPSSALGFFLLSFRIPSLTAAILRETIGATGKAFADFVPRCDHDLEMLYHVTKLAFYYYYQLRKDGLEITGVRYEDLAEHPDAVIPKILDLSGIPRSYVTKASAAMATDSQQLSDVSQARVSQLRAEYDRRFKPTQRLLDHVRSQWEAVGLPDPGLFTDRDFRLPGSIEP